MIIHDYMGQEVDFRSVPLSVAIVMFHRAVRNVSGNYAEFSRRKAENPQTLQSHFYQMGGPCVKEILT